MLVINLQVVDMFLTICHFVLKNPRKLGNFLTKNNQINAHQRILSASFEPSLSVPLAPRETLFFRLRRVGVPTQAELANQNPANSPNVGATWHRVFRPWELRSLSQTKFVFLVRSPARRRSNDNVQAGVPGNILIFYNNILNLYAYLLIVCGYFGCWILVVMVGLESLQLDSVQGQDYVVRIRLERVQLLENENKALFLSDE